MSMMLLWHSLTQQGLTPEWYQVFLVSMVGSAILEYATSWTLERLFHARWWDYSNMPLNLNGRISVPSSVFFGLGGLLVVYVLYEPTLSMTTHAALETSSALTERLAGTTKQDDPFIEERERFAASLRDTWLGNMSHVGREALRRAKSYTPKVGAPNIPGAEQLGKLMSDVRAKHWQRDDERDKAA